MNDDLMPNDGTYFIPREPVEQAIDRKKERANALADITELKKMVARLDERIAFYEKVTSIPEEVRTNPQEFLIMHNSHTMIAEILKSEKDYLEDLISTNSR